MGYFAPQASADCFCSLAPAPSSECSCAISLRSIRRARTAPASPASSTGRIDMMSWPPTRSEEHTSELQSLMRISYAVFCLKKKILTNLSLLNQIHQIKNNEHRQIILAQS